MYVIVHNIHIQIDKYTGLTIFENSVSMLPITHTDIKKARTDSLISDMPAKSISIHRSQDIALDKAIFRFW